MSLFWRPYLPLFIILNSIYVLYPYIRFDVVIRSHSETCDAKTNVLYLYMFKGYIETELGESVEVHHFEYYNFNQIELSDSTPKITTVEAITNNNTLLQLGIFNAFGNVTQRIENETHTVISCLIQPMLQNHGNPIFTTLCRFQLFGEEEKEASVS